MAGPLQLAPGAPRTLAYGRAIRRDMRLLEVDEGVLGELLEGGCGRAGRGEAGPAFKPPPQRQPPPAGPRARPGVAAAQLAGASDRQTRSLGPPLLLPLERPPLPARPRRSLCLKGAPGEEAVLCTRDKTYAVKAVETTNLLLLVQQQPPQPQPQESGGAGTGGAAAPLASQDTNVQPTPPGALTGLATQLQKVGRGQRWGWGRRRRTHAADCPRAGRSAATARLRRTRRRRRRRPSSPPPSPRATWSWCQRRRGCTS